MTGINLILVTFDAMRRDVVGVYDGPGDRLGLTPNLDRFAEESTVFTKPFTNGPVTEHSFISMLTSRYSHETGIDNSEATFVAELLSEAGYRTAAFHSSPVLLSHNNFHRGFDVYPGTPTAPPTGNREPPDASGPDTAVSEVRSTILDQLQDLVHRNPIVYSWVKGIQFRSGPPFERAGRINERCFDYLKDAGEEPLFLWVHYMDTHDPYLPETEYLELPFTPDMSAWEAAKLNTRLNIVSGNDFDTEEMDEQDMEKLRSLYYAQVRRVDDAFGELIDRLKQEGLYEDSLVVVGSDHGEQFFEHGWIRHSKYIYDELLKVPLIIKPPAGEQGEPSVSGLTSFIDITPTLLDYAGVDAPEGLRGRSLRHAMVTGRSERDSVVGIRINGEEGERVGTARTSDWKLIVDENQGVRELYDVDNDPGETMDRFGDVPDVQAELEAVLEEKLDWADWCPNEFRNVTDSDGVTSDIHRRLQDLGYR